LYLALNPAFSVAPSNLLATADYKLAYTRHSDGILTTTTTTNTSIDDDNGENDNNGTAEAKQQQIIGSDR